MTLARFYPGILRRARDVTHVTRLFADAEQAHELIAASTDQELIENCYALRARKIAMVFISRFTFSAVWRISICSWLNCLQYWHLISHLFTSFWKLEVEFLCEKIVSGTFKRKMSSKNVTVLLRRWKSEKCELHHFPESSFSDSLFRCKMTSPNVIWPNRHGWESKFETTKCRTTDISKFQNCEY